MKRRSFLRGVGASVAILATACAAPPKAAARTIRVGAFTGEKLPADGARPPVEQDVNEGLRDEGLVAGTNMTIEWRHTQGSSELYGVFADELVRLPVDILIASSGSAITAARAATSTIPIVMSGGPDPIENGWIRSYARPGGNVTGPAFSNVAESVKRLELLHEAFPTISRVVAIGNVPFVTNGAAILTELRRAADTLGVRLSAPEMSTYDDLSRGLSSAGSADALLILGNTLTFENVDRIIAVAAERRLPAVYSREEYVTAGGLLSYGSNRQAIRKGVGWYVRRIAEGASPGDLAVRLPQRFDLAVNLATAQRAELALPASVLGRATTVVR